MLRQSGWLACAGILGLLAGCAQAPTHADAGAAGLNGLYAKLDQATVQYDQALEQARRGDNAQSQKTLEAALDAMRSVSDACVNTPGCDTQRFLSAYDRALRLKDGSFLGTEDDDDTVEDQDQVTAGADSGVLATLPQAQRTVQLLHGHTLSDLVATNGSVQAALQVWLTRLRPNLIRAYVDYQYLRYQMWPAFHQAGLPEAVLFGIMAKESGGNVHAVSRSGAAGPLQFMPATGSRFGLNTIDGFDQRFDPTMASRAAASYLDEQLGELNDDLALVLAAYNGGEGRVGRLADGTQNANFWDPDIYFSLSAETREYVPMVLAAAWLFLHPAEYNLRFPKVDGAAGHIDLANAASLNELSVCLGNDANAHYGWYRTLRNLNPQLRPSDVQAKGTRINVPKFLEGAYQRSCVSGKWVALADELQDAQLPERLAAADPPRIGHYTVRRGDTLSAIARRFHCDGVRELVRSNHLRSASRLQIGKRLKLDGCTRR
jgi:membrane-bound lytic murein transglycosylase D